MNEENPAAPNKGTPDRFSVDLTGETLLGVYRVEQKLAEGGMGSIFLAEDTNLGRKVVVKVPHPRFLGEPGFRARFAREVAELTRLEHPSIARILARGEHEDLPFFILQYLGGGSLEDRFDAAPNSRTPIDDVFTWLATVAKTLDFVHARGIVHRDIKPANILFDEEGNVFLSDFGVAKVLEGEDGALTATGAGIGSPKYMAPEQGLGKKITAAADQYSLASLVFEALSGRAPFTSASIIEIMIEKGKEDAPDLADLVPDLPEAASRAVQKALARDPAARYSTCRKFVKAFAAGLGRAVDVTTGSVNVPGSAGEASPTGTMVLSGRKRAGHWITMFLAAAALLAAGLWIGLSGRDDPDVQGEQPVAGSPDGPADPEDRRVTLIDRGQAPLRKLRYLVVEGSRERMLLTTDSGVYMKTGDNVIDMPNAPTMTMGTDVLLEKVTSDGRIDFRWDVTSVDGGKIDAPPGTNPGAVPATTIDRLAGLSTRGVANHRGICEIVEIEGFEDSPEEGRELLASLGMGARQFFTPLPMEPVGVGARWEISESVSQMGMRFTQTTVYRLISLEGYRARLEVAIALAAPPQDMDMSLFGTDASGRLRSFHAGGEGEVRLDLTQIVPTAMTMSMQLDMDMTVDVKDDKGKRSVEMKFNVSTTMERR